MCVGVWQSLCVFVFPFYSDQVGEANPDGRTNGLFSIGLTAYTSLVLTVTFQVSLITSPRNVARPLNVGTTVGSIGVLFAFAGAYCSLDSLFPDAYGVAARMFAQPAFWLVLPVSVVAALLPNVITRLIKFALCPKPHHVLAALGRHRREGGGGSLSKSSSTTSSSASSLASSVIPPADRPRSGFAFAQDAGHGALIQARTVAPEEDSDQD